MEATTFAKVKERLNSAAAWNSAVISREGKSQSRYEIRFGGKKSALRNTARSQRRKFCGGKVKPLIGGVGIWQR